MKGNCRFNTRCNIKMMIYININLVSPKFRYQFDNKSGLSHKLIQTKGFQFELFPIILFLVFLGLYFSSL